MFTDQSDSTESFIALAPYTPLHTEIQESTWTILPTKPSTTSSTEQTTDQQSWIKVSPSSSSCQSFLKVFAAVDHNRHGTHIPRSIEVRVMPAQPLVLDTVYVTVEKHLLQKVDDIQSRFGGGFHQYGRNKLERKNSGHNGSSHASPLPTEDRMINLVRQGLSGLSLVHSGVVFPLPLPAHPITHVRPPPAIAVECEPVSQGRISPRTKIVLVQAGSSQEKALKKLAPAPPIIEESLEDTAEDTSNDQFYSAAEDRHAETASEIDGATDDDSATEQSSQEQSDEESDSMDDMISLSAPGLPPQPAGTLSAMTAATPRPGGLRGAGTHTPGSIYSSFTATTARAGSRPGKVFRTEALLKQVPKEVLHPQPTVEDDDQSFVFVDTSTLAKIGCFSGDWIRIEVAKNISSRGFPSSGFAGLNGYGEEEESDWRAAKIFGLSGLSNQKARYAVDKTGDRRSSFSQAQSFMPLTPSIYLSPILLTNLANAQYVKVGAVPRAPRQDQRGLQSQRPVTSARNPPLAREVALTKVATPMTTSRELQATLFSSLKQHFETSKRVVKRGDLIAIPVDEELAKTTASSIGSEGIPSEEELTARLNMMGHANGTKIGLAWFSVQYVDAETSADQDGNSEPDPWGGVAMVDSSNTRLSQAGSSNQSVPHTIGMWTKYWLGLRHLARSSSLGHEVVTTTADLPALGQLPLEQRLSDLIAASTSPRAVNLGLPPLVILLHSVQRQIGKTYIATSACSAVGVHTFSVSAHDVLSENANTTGGGDVKTEALLKARAERALSCGPQQTALLIQHIDVLTADRMVPALQDIISASRVLIATTTKIDDIPAGIRSLFTHELQVGAPNEVAREIILRNACLSTSLPLSPSINFKNLALQTAALVAGDLLDVVNRASVARRTRLLDLAESQSCTVSDIFLSGGQAATHLVPSDFTSAISAARSTFSDAIGAPKIPTVTWADVGGLASQKDAIMETISLPLTRPDLFANGIRKRSGILFYGPPGTGKTLLAKAIATEFSLNFFSVKGPELLNMYIGESEANVRRVFQRARDARPCVVFFDELDSVAPKRGNQGDSGGVMDRIVSQLLAELDGMSSGGSSDDSAAGASSSGVSGGGGVFVIGATNRPDLLDPALLRPGRFDKMLYLGVADSHDQQVTILRALTRRFTLSSSVDLERVASRLPFTYTGADLYALCSDAMLKAITRKTGLVDEKVREISQQRGEEVTTGYFFDHLAGEDDVRVVVEEGDFDAANKELVGSVSRKELDHFERIRGLFEEQDIGGGDVAGTKGKEKAKERRRSMGVELPVRWPSAAQQLSQRYAPSQPPTGQSQGPDTSKEAKGKGKQKEKIADHARAGGVIANPNSDADDDYGVGVGHMNGSVNGGSAKGKAKERLRLDGFAHDVEGDDEDLYT